MKQSPLLEFASSEFAIEREEDNETNPGEMPNQWRVFIFAEGGIVARLLGRDRSAEAVESLYRQVKECLQKLPDISDVCEHVL